MDPKAEEGQPGLLALELLSTSFYYGRFWQTNMESSSQNSIVGVEMKVRSPYLALRIRFLSTLAFGSKMTTLEQEKYLIVKID